MMLFRLHRKTGYRLFNLQTSVLLSTDSADMTNLWTSAPSPQKNCGEGHLCSSVTNCALHGMWFILPDRGANHIIILILTFVGERNLRSGYCMCSLSSQQNSLRGTGKNSQFTSSKVQESSVYSLRFAFLQNFSAFFI